nr:immunoglobulin light chain junction region [Mus musculus]NSL97691.1 immunoglobulin light chain junction region [Mus musculus]NSL97763.1 immunoglobulin light chain junction region [Mus musculus]NSL99151.1 immunoglobulin light chain junction region [Mus musculus]NSM00115.1 immunoglobulin light chain junction region [Mus musculus]
CQQHNEYPYTF